MMDANTPRIRSLLRQAKRTEDAGKRVAAEELYEDIVNESPETVDGWLGLARVQKESTAKEASYSRALILDEENAEAVKGLAVLRGEKLSEVLDPDLHPLPFEEDAANQISAEPVEAVEDLSTAEPMSDEVISDLDNGPVTTVDLAGGEGLEIDHDHQSESTVEVLYCANHPSRETHLRCNRCGKPICSTCAQPTPVGYRCPECIREHEEKFYSATLVDYLVAALIAFPLGFVAGFLAWRFTSVGFFAFFLIFLAPAVGTFLARIVMRAVGRRRGRWLPHMVAAAIVLPGLLFLLATILIFHLFGIILLGIYVVSASGAAYYQMR